MESVHESLARRHTADELHRMATEAEIRESSLGGVAVLGMGLMTFGAWACVKGVPEIGILILVCGGVNGVLALCARSAPASDDLRKAIAFKNERLSVKR